MNRKSLDTVHTHTHTHTLYFLNKGLFVESESLYCLNMLKIKANELV